jgi:hypothetical protein
VSTMPDRSQIVALPRFVTGSVTLTLTLLPC